MSALFEKEDLLPNSEGEDRALNVAVLGGTLPSADTIVRVPEVHSSGVCSRITVKTKRKALLGRTPAFTCSLICVQGIHVYTHMQPRMQTSTQSHVPTGHTHRQVNMYAPAHAFLMGTWLYLRHKYSGNDHYHGAGLCLQNSCADVRTPVTPCGCT